MGELAALGSGGGPSLARIPDDDDDDDDATTVVSFTYYSRRERLALTKCVYIEQCRKNHSILSVLSKSFSPIRLLVSHAQVHTYIQR